METAQTSTKRKGSEQHGPTNNNEDTVEPPKKKNMQEDGRKPSDGPSEQEKGNNLNNDSGNNNMNENSNDQFVDGVYPWILPEGAAVIVKRIAAEYIFEELIVGCLEKEDYASLNKEIYHLVQQFPSICHRSYSFGNQAKFAPVIPRRHFIGPPVVPTV